MNPILIAGAIVLAALAATLHQRQAARTAATELARLQAEQAAASPALAELQARSEATARRQSELSLDLSRASAELRAASEAALRARTEPDPATEGSWPSGQPYFYLPKRFLADIGYAALTPDGNPTPEAIALLGLTPSERDDLRNAWADFRFELQELQLQSAERMPDTNAVPDPNQRAIQFKLSSLSNQLPRLREQLDTRLTEAVGATRAQLLRGPLEERLAELTHPLGDRDCLIAYHAERAANGTVRHWLRFDAVDGSVSYHYPVATLAPGQSSSDTEGLGVPALSFPIGPGSPLWPYRHLFGDQPLLLPP